MVTVDGSSGNDNIEVCTSYWGGLTDDLAIKQYYELIAVDKQQATQLIEILKKFIDGEEI